MKAIKIVIGTLLVIGVLWFLVRWDTKETWRAVAGGDANGRLAIENYRDIARAEMAAEKAEATLLRCEFSGRGRSEGECLSAMAQEPPPLLKRLPMEPPYPYPNVVQPDPAVLVAASCPFGPEGGHPLVLIKGQDPTTHYWVGIALATCRDGIMFRQSTTYRQGCADLSWDPTGTTITYKIRFQEVVPEATVIDRDTRRAWFKDIHARCFDNDWHVLPPGLGG